VERLIDTRTRSGPLRELIARGRAAWTSADRRTPVAVKLVVPLGAIVVLAAVAYALVAVPSLQGELQRAYAAEAREIVTIVQAEYEVYGGDPTPLNTFVQNLVRFDPTVRRIRVYRLVGGSPVLWASSEPSERSTYRPRPQDTRPLATGESAQEIEIVDGVRLLETVGALRVGGRIDASIGVYSSLDTLDAAVADIIRIVMLTAVVGGLALCLAAAAVLEAVVLRPIGRLHGAALRVAAGDLGVRLPEGDLPPARDELRRVAREFDRMVRIVAEQRAEVERVAATDGLTGLVNRRSFDDRLGTEVERARRLKYPLVITIVDLDGFKKLNDSQGHLAGDDALRRVADALAGAVRGSDVLARYGGDEFAVIQPGCDSGSAAIVGARLRAAVERLDIAIDPRTGQLLTASVGAAALRSGYDAIGVLAAADAALYRAKERGGGVEVTAEDR